MLATLHRPAEAHRAWYEPRLRALAGELADDRASLAILLARPRTEHRADRIALLERDIARQQARFDALLATARAAVSGEVRYPTAPERN